MKKNVGDLKGALPPLKKFLKKHLMMEEKEKTESYHEKLSRILDEYAHYTYKITKQFPNDEQFLLTYQLRKDAIGIILKYEEGISKKREKEYKASLERAYSLLNETKYLFRFALDENLKLCKKQIKWMIR